MTSGQVHARLLRAAGSPLRAWMERRKWAIDPVVYVAHAAAQPPDADEVRLLLARVANGWAAADHGPAPVRVSVLRHTGGKKTHEDASFTDKAVDAAVASLRADGWTVTVSEPTRWGERTLTLTPPAAEVEARREAKVQRLAGAPPLPILLRPDPRALKFRWALATPYGGELLVREGYNNSTRRGSAPDVRSSSSTYWRLPAGTPLPEGYRIEAPPNALDRLAGSPWAPVRDFPVGRSTAYTIARTAAATADNRYLTRTVGWVGARGGGAFLATDGSAACIVFVPEAPPNDAEVQVPADLSDLASVRVNQHWALTADRLWRLDPVPDVLMVVPDDDARQDVVLRAVPARALSKVARRTGVVVLDVERGQIHVCKTDRSNNVAEAPDLTVDVEFEATSKAPRLILFNAGYFFRALAQVTLSGEPFSLSASAKGPAVFRSESVWAVVMPLRTDVVALPWRRK